MPTIRIKCFRDLIQVYFRQIRSTIKAISYKSKLMESLKRYRHLHTVFTDLKKAMSGH